MRREGVGAAIAAVIYNRGGDLFLLGMLVTVDLKWWMYVAVMGKSALWVISY